MNTQQQWDALVERLSNGPIFSTTHGAAGIAGDHDGDHPAE